MRHRLRTLGLIAAATVLPLTAAGTATAAPTVKAVGVSRTSVLRTITVGSNPYDVAVAQQLGKAFVVNDGSVTEISLITHRKLSDFGTGGYHGQNAIVLTGNDTRGWITNNMIKTVTVIDTEKSRVTSQIPVGYGAAAVAKANTSSGQRVYVLTTKPAGLSHPATNSLIAIQASSGRIISRTALPDVGGNVTTSPDAKSVWVGSEIDGRIWQVSTATGKITKTLKPTKAGPVTGITFAPGGKVWVTGLGGVSVLKASDGSLIKFITAPAIFPKTFVVPNGVEINGSGTYAVIENSVPDGVNGYGAVALMDTRTYKVTRVVRTGSTPEGFALDTKRGMAYVPSYDDDTLTFFTIPK